jgi:hypothetical protein
MPMPRHCSRINLLTRTLLLIVVVWFPSASWGQVNKSNLVGVVRDSSGAPIPGVSIRAVNAATGATRQEVTDETGLYRFTLLDYGLYRLEAQLEGFKQFVQDRVQLATGETTTIDIMLSVGDLSESVQVTAESPLLRTETGALGMTVSTEVLSDLPLIGRNPYVFLTLAAGIQYTGSPSALNPWDVFGPSDFTATGSEARSEFLLDGIPNMRLDVVSFSPSPDAVQEMRVHTNAYDAEFGHSGASFVNVSTRSGANDMHGTVYWFHRNDKLNAGNFFDNRVGRGKARNRQHTYGGSFGGPVWFPNLYNGRDHTHYFINFEGTQIRGQSFARAIVPTELERRGDFSQTRDRQGRPFTIYDPATTRPSGSGFIRDPFPGNVIPLERMDPVALKALAYYPLPNRTPTADDPQNFVNSQISARKWASVFGRVDHQISASQQLFSRYGWNHRSDPSSPFYGDCCRPAGNPTTGQDEFERGNIAGGISWTWVVSRTTVADVRMGYTRYFEANIMYGEGFDLSTLGFPASFANSVIFSTFPRFEMGGDIDNLGAGRTTTRGYINQYNPLFNVHTMLGRHALKYGFRYQLGQRNDFAPQRAGGFFRFDKTFTQGPDPTRTASNSGHDLASFLLGTPTRGYVDINAAPRLQNTYWAVYLQDDWKLTDALALNLGLRMEHEGATTDRFNRGNAGFDFNAVNPLAARAQANYAANPIPELRALNVRGGLRFLNEDGAPRGHLDMPALLWAPRLGFAYRTTDWMVVRGGYGMFYVPNNTSNYRLDGFSLATEMITSLDNNLTSFNRLSNPFPNGLTTPPGAAGGLLTGVGQRITAGRAGEHLVPQFKHGYSEQFSLGAQFVLPGAVSMETSYVGNVSRRLTITRNINEVPDEFLSLRTRLNARVANPFYQVITDPTSALSQPTVTVSQLLRPLPHFLGVTEAVLPLGTSDYNSLQFQLNKRMSNGLTFGASYTLSKMMEATAYLNDNDGEPEQVMSNSDRPHRVVLHGLYDLPFGTGKRWLSDTNTILNELFGGWQFNWVATFQSGAPLDFANPGADRVSDSDDDPHTVDQWFDTAQFTPREPFTLRSLPSRLADIRAAGIHKWDFTVSRSFQLSQGVALKIRAELYNAFNRTHFGTPNTVVTNRNFGTITGTFLGPREIQLAARLVF